MHRGKPSIDIAKLKELAKTDMRQTEVAAALGVSNPAVIRSCKVHGIVLAGKRPQAPRTSRKIPGWVPAEFRHEYSARTRLYGEEAAASWARKMKAEAAR